jgi:transposase-like protein
VAQAILYHLGGYALAIAAKAQSQKRNTNRSWRMDETYIKLKGKWVYLYRAVDSQGDTLDFMLSERRDEDAATAKIYLCFVSESELLLQWLAHNG